MDLKIFSLMVTEIYCNILNNYYFITAAVDDMNYCFNNRPKAFSIMIERNNIILNLKKRPVIRNTICIMITQIAFTL